MSVSLLRAGAAGALFYAFAQSVQALIFLGLPAGGDVAANFTFETSLANQVRVCLMLASFIGLIVVYVAAQRAARPDRHGWALLGMVFAVLFAANELLYRSIELVAILDWQRDWLATADAAVRAAIEAKINTAGEIIRAIYLLLFLLHAGASLCFVVALGCRDRIEQALRIAFALNIVRLLGRFLQGYAGQAWLGPVNANLYLPVTLLHMLLFALWLWRRANLARDELRRSPAG